MRENIWLDTESSIIEDKGIFIEKCFESILKMYFCFFFMIQEVYNIKRGHTITKEREQEYKWKRDSYKLCS